MIRRWMIIAVVALMGASAVPAELPTTPATPLVVNFNSDAPGAPPTSFEAVVGDWYVADLAGAHGLLVDGSKWRQGVPSANLADQARRLYGERYAEFLDGVKSYAYFPLAVWQGDCSGDDLTMSVRFYPQDGRIDQGAGIAWGIAPDGSYFGVRANALEDNLLFFRVVRGKRTIIDTVRGVSTPTRTWHTLKVRLQGRNLAVDVDGQERLTRDTDTQPSGRCGLWSKADSQVLFDDFTVARDAR
ncbi:MAG: hypothetical protein HYR72_24390 [Deltaproteobacteria bacterium]|nr:hypothetical protein [Deltaproteobacteria bacterium]MBI3389242.1 hypothetical protein [Deltaproteobacteria bacterium]